MADLLTQLQDYLDDLLTQMYATLKYINDRHPYSEIPGQPSQAPQPQPQPPSFQQPAAIGTAATTTTIGASRTNVDASEQASAPPTDVPLTPVPEAPDAFTLTMHELAQDLVLKEQQIEYVIQNLPGLGNSEAYQQKKLQQLEAQLKLVEEERAHKEQERQAMVDLLGEVMIKIKRIP